MAKKEGAISRKKLQRILQIHRLLRTGKSYSGKMLEEACREVDPEVSTRTVASDIEFLRDVLLAPIPEKSNRWTNYYYERDYSIFEGLDDSFIGGLNEVLAIVRQLSKKKTDFSGLEDLLLRLEQRASALNAEQNNLILFDEPQLKGRKYLIPLYRGILDGHTFDLTYEPFDMTAETYCIRPCLLKEFNKRWYVFGWRQGMEEIQKYPLDRICNLKKSTVFLPKRDFNAVAYFWQMLGVTCDAKKPDPILVKLRFSPLRGKYVITKKIHQDQKEEVLEDGRVMISFSVLHNKELEAKILEFGSDIEVLEPSTLKDSIVNCLRKALDQYHN